MSKNNEQRRNLLTRFFQAEENFDDLITQLSAYEWDFDGSPVILDRSALKRVLAKYIQGGLSALEIEKWADFIEVRDDVDYPETDKEMLSNIISELANPDIQGKLTPEKAKSFVSKL